MVIQDAFIAHKQLAVVTRRLGDKIMKSPLVAASLSLAVLGGAAAPQMAAAQPVLTVQSEVAAHPRIVLAIHQMEASYRELQAAPDDFGGNKAQAMSDLQNAIHSLRKALFYRLRLDDRAVDAAQF